MVLLDHHHVLLRRAATLVHAVPGATLEVTADGTPVLEVGRDHDGTAGDGIRRASPCGFRNAVARAGRLHESGLPVTLLGLDSTALELRLDPGPQAELLDGDVVRARISDRVVGLVATTLPAIDAACALEADDIPTDRLRAHVDEALGTTLLHLDLTGEVADGDGLDLLVRTRDACAVAELLHGVQPIRAL